MYSVELPGAAPMRPAEWQAVRLALGTASALGLARFAYGLLVPAMRYDLDWSLAEAGAMSTANGLGYLAGALVTAVLVRQAGTAVVFRWGMILTAAALAATAVSSNYLALLTARAAAGAAGALVFIAGGVIASRIATRTSSTAPITIYFAGTGLGIAFSGATVPMLSHDWRVAWVLLSAAAGLATLVSWTAARTDEDMHAASAGRARMGPLRRTAVAYLLFSAGYISYITFLSVYLADQHASATQVVLTWTSLGLAVVAAPAVWRGPMTNWPGTRTLATLLGVLGGSAALALLAPTPPIIVASAIVYGATFMSVPAGIAALIRDKTPPADWTATLAAFTTLFALGQTAGPWIAGMFADRTSTDATLVWTAALCTVAAVIAATERTGAPIAGSFGSSSSGGCPGATTHANLGERGSELPTRPALGASYARLSAWTADEEPPVRGMVKPPSAGRAVVPARTDYSSARLTAGARVKGRGATMIHSG